MSRMGQVVLGGAQLIVPPTLALPGTEEGIARDHTQICFVHSDDPLSGIA
jgi:hypothetical protein